MTNEVENKELTREEKRKKRLNLRKLKLLNKDPFGNVILFKRLLIGAIGTFTYGRFNLVNNMKLKGTEYLLNLPNKNVMFVSNHQTYYADVIALYHVFCSVKWRFRNTLKLPLYLLVPRANTYYVAAEETMKDSGILPKLFSYAGAVTVKRSWRHKGENVKRGADTEAPDKIAMALKQGWVVNFPQGTTSPYAPLRKGTANIIKQLQPIVVPVVIDGFRRAFDKKGFFFKKRGTTLSITFKEPLHFSSEESIDNILDRLAKVIEQKRPEELGAAPVKPIKKEASSAEKIKEKSSGEQSANKSAS